MKQSTKKEMVNITKSSQLQDKEHSYFAGRTEHHTKRTSGLRVAKQIIMGSTPSDETTRMTKTKLPEDTLDEMLDEGNRGQRGQQRKEIS